MKIRYLLYMSENMTPKASNLKSQHILRKRRFDIVLGEVEVGNCQFLHRSIERNASIWRAIRRKGENAPYFLLPELSGFAVYDCGEEWSSCRI